MNVKMLCLGALALSLCGGAAFAAGSGSSALDNSEMMKPFYTDSTMKTMVPEAEFKAAWMKMSKTRPRSDDERMRRPGHRQGSQQLLCHDQTARRRQLVADRPTTSNEKARRSGVRRAGLYLDAEIRTRPRIHRRASA